jgi:DNA-binding response OmpR family regulator
LSIGDILGEHHKILIVEDDEIISQVIEWRLINLGYSVSGKAATGKDAIAPAL